MQYEYILVLRDTENDEVLAEISAFSMSSLEEQFHKLDGAQKRYEEKLLKQNEDE